MPKIRNMTDLTTDLCQMYEDLRSGKIEYKEAVEVNNTAGKIISAAKTQIAYAALRGEKPEIPFLAAPLEEIPTFPAATQLIASGEKNRKAA